MGAKYSIAGAQTLTTSRATALTLVGAAANARRAKIYEMNFGSAGTPADVAVQHLVERVSADGTVTAIVPEPLDPADPTSAMIAGSNATSEPTYTAASTLFSLPLNMRATFRWVAAPGGELVTPATNDQGVGYNALHASATHDIEGQMYFEEG